jgi:hypothetical protein
MTKDQLIKALPNTVSGSTKRLAAVDGIRLGGPQQLRHGGLRA